MRTERKRDLAFVVESPADQGLVLELAARVLGSNEGLASVPLMGSPRVMPAESFVLVLLDKGYRQVFVVFDSDAPPGDSDDAVALVASRVYETVAPAYGRRGRRTGASGNVYETSIPVRVVATEPTIEKDWLRGMVVSGKDPAAYAKAARRINLAALRRRSRSFAQFHDALQALKPGARTRRVQRPAHL